MVKITIDGTDYETEHLSDNAKAQLASLQYLQAHKTQLQNEIAVYETAKRAYIANLKVQLQAKEPVS
jgi:hypothetical protein